MAKGWERHAAEMRERNARRARRRATDERYARQELCREFYRDLAKRLEAASDEALHRDMMPDRVKPVYDLGWRDAMRQIRQWFQAVRGKA